MMYERNRRRRLIYNDDSDQVSQTRSYDYAITDVPSFLAVRTTPVFETQVDTYAWCVGTGAMPPYGKKGDQVWPILGSFERATDIVVNACHEHDLEVWGSLRMNDLHDSFMADRLEDTNDPLKAQHPEYLIAVDNRTLPSGLADRFLWTAFDFSHREVREHRLSFIEENAQAHDFDGYELDFTRFPWYFPLGEGLRNAHRMTDLVRRARAILDDIGRRRHRPYTLVAHVTDSPQISVELGVDVEAMLREKLVDVLVVGLGYIHDGMGLSDWQNLGQRYGVPVYPSVNAAVFTRKYIKLPHGQPQAVEALRATAACWHQQGARGIYLFNLFVWQDKNIGGYTREQVIQPLSEIGSAERLAGKNKLYSLQASIDRASISHGSEMALLPIALDSNEHLLPLHMGPDAYASGAQFCLRVLTKGAAKDTALRLRLNQILLEPQREGDWWTVEIPQSIIRTGQNALCVWCDQDLDQVDHPVVVRRVFVEVTYAASS